MCYVAVTRKLLSNGLPEHIHMLVSIPPKMSVSSFMGYLKGKVTIITEKMNGEYDTKFPQAKALYLYMFAHPGKN